MVVILFIVLFVAWLMINLINYFNSFTITKNANFTHSNVLEIIWTSIPALILVVLATPSFTLLYSMDELINPVINFKIIGHQWYWSYELSDYSLCGTQSEDNNLRLFVSAADVLHSWTVPSFGVKVDACPGRLN